MLELVYDLGVVRTSDVQVALRAHRLGSRYLYQLVGGILRVLFYGTSQSPRQFGIWRSILNLGT